MKTLFLGLGIALLPAAGFAAPITLPQSDINTMVFDVGMSSANVLDGSDNLGFFDVAFNTYDPGPGLGVFVASPLSMSYTPGDVLSLVYTNNDLSTWGFEVTVLTNGGTYSSGIVDISAGDITILSVVLGAGDTITGVHNAVSGLIPNTSNVPGLNDVAVDWRVQTVVPEPGSLLLVGTGLLALGFLPQRIRSRHR